MVTILFHSTIFGPIHSRRLGTSLGINLLPNDGKICSFDCLYCEAGYNSQGAGRMGFPKRNEVSRLLESKLKAMSEGNEQLDTITFSGNGEPTLHPDFSDIIDDVILMRDIYFPMAKISVLSNATHIGDAKIATALRKIDNNILKLDSAIDTTMRRLNRPLPLDFDLEKTIIRLSQFGSQCIIQTMLLRGTHDGIKIDNATDEEIAALIAAYKRINPQKVMLYSIDRKTPEEALEKIPLSELKAIGEKIKKENITIQIS